MHIVESTMAPCTLQVILKPGSHSRFLALQDAIVGFSSCRTDKLNFLYISTLIMNLKKGKSEAMLCGTSKRLNMANSRQLNIQVDGTGLNCTTNYKYLCVIMDPSLNFDSHFSATYKKQLGELICFVVFEVQLTQQLLRGSIEP